jgi:hypothetical protein
VNIHSTLLNEKGEVKHELWSSCISIYICIVQTRTHSHIHVYIQVPDLIANIHSNLLNEKGEVKYELWPLEAIYTCVSIYICIVQTRTHTYVHIYIQIPDLIANIHSTLLNEKGEVKYELWLHKYAKDFFTIHMAFQGIHPVTKLPKWYVHVCVCPYVYMHMYM